VLQAEIVVRSSIKDVKMDVEAANWSLLLKVGVNVTLFSVFGGSCVVDERGDNFVAGELISSRDRDILLQLLQAETVGSSFEDVKMDEEAAS